MRLRDVLGLCLLFAGGSCAAVPVGSVVIYSDGSVEKLLADDGGTLRWEDDRKRTFVRSSNPIVPALEKTAFLSGRGYRQAISQGDPDAIRGLPAGTRVGFSLVRTRHDGDSSRRHWECVSLGAVRQKVLGVQRRLERYSCERFSIHRKLHNRSFRERRDFSYSPDLGLVVELQRETRKRRSSRTLVAVYPPGETGYKRISRAVRKIRSRD